MRHLRRVGTPGRASGEGSWRADLGQRIGEERAAHRGCGGRRGPDHAGRRTRAPADRGRCPQTREARDDPDAASTGPVAPVGAHRPRRGRGTGLRGSPLLQGGDPDGGRDRARTQGDRVRGHGALRYPRPHAQASFGSRHVPGAGPVARRVAGGARARMGGVDAARDRPRGRVRGAARSDGQAPPAPGGEAPRPGSDDGRVCGVDHDVAAFRASASRYPWRTAWRSRSSPAAASTRTPGSTSRRCATRSARPSPRRTDGSRPTRPRCSFPTRSSSTTDGAWSSRRARTPSPPVRRTSSASAAGSTAWSRGAAPRARRGGIVAFLDTGAYQDASASNFNALPRPATVLVHGSEAEFIKRAETIDDVFARDIVPARLGGEV